jgi:hypothetical protein
MFTHSFSQKISDSLARFSVSHANTLSVHPFGIFMSRINTNFQLKADKNLSVTANISSGNIWLPRVKSDSPINESDRNEVSKLNWYNRDGMIAFLNNAPTKTTKFEADGVIRLYQIQLNLPLSDQHEIKVNSRMFSLDGGKIPTSIVTNDELIEWFHSNVAGGENPFARKAFEYDQAKIRYSDEEGNTFQINSGDFIFSGIDLSYYYYPQFKSLEERSIYTNFGVQVGANLNDINPSFDLGLNGTIIKSIHLKRERRFNVGLSVGAMRMQVLAYGEAVQLITRKNLVNSEFLFEYLKHYKNKSLLSFAVSWITQNSFNKKSDFETIILAGERSTSHWHLALSHLYDIRTSYNFMISYAKGDFAYSTYFREDFTVNNAPDTQGGIGVKYYFK